MEGRSTGFLEMRKALKAASNVSELIAAFLAVYFYYHGSVNFSLIPLAAFATLIEAITLKGLDNLSVSILTAVLYLWIA